MSDGTITPAGFFGHGSPMNTLERNRYTDAWRAFGECVGKPRAVLVISAHWYINATAVTAMARPRVIHDFYGFPEELFAFDYPAPGHPEVAELVAETVKPRWVGLDVDGWGLDHGTWSVLAHVFPDADVPVVQLSINSLEPLAYHLDIGARLAPLRDAGVLILGSGNVVHNLRRIDWNRPTAGFDWNQRFDEAAASLMQNSPGDLLKLAEHPDYGFAVPTPDHFIPLLYIGGLAAASNATPDVFIDGSTYGSISMTSYSLGVDCPEPTGDTAAAPLSDPSIAPPEQSNI